MTSRSPSRQLAVFFGVAFAISWILQAPFVLATLKIIPGPPEKFMGPMGLAAFGPLLAAVIVSAVSEGKPGVRGIFRLFGDGRRKIGWIALALCLPALLHLAGAAACAAAGSRPPRWIYPPENAQHIAALIVFPLGEEVGWRGFALPRMLREQDPLRASLILGALWWLWHLPTFFLPEVTPTVPILFGYVMAMSVWITWLWRRAGGGLLVALAAHVGIHLDNVNHALPGDSRPLWTLTIAAVIGAVAVVAVDRKAFSRGTAPA